MFHHAEDYEARAAECEGLALATRDLVLREDLFSLARIYRDYAGHLRGRSNENEIAWPKVVNG